MSEITTSPASATIDQLGEVLRNHQSFVLISHVRPDGDAIGSQLALGFSLMAAGKTVYLINEDGLPDNLAFLAGSDKIEHGRGRVGAAALDDCRDHHLQLQRSRGHRCPSLARERPAAQVLGYCLVRAP